MAAVIKTARWRNRILRSILISIISIAWKSRGDNVFRPGLTWMRLSFPRLRIILYPMGNPKQTTAKAFLSEEILARFIRYVKIDTTSDRNAEKIPSTPGQMVLMNLLLEEIKGMGFADAEIVPPGYLIARIPATQGSEDAPCIGLMAHVDTASDVSGSGVRPIVHKGYDGGDIVLEAGVTISPGEFPELAERAGDAIVTSDGRTLLGADDKAGVAIIMASLSWMASHGDSPRGPLEIVFTPDEETGKGLDAFDAKWLSSRACYTFDGGKLGELEYECFNAYEARATFTGSVIHLGSAVGRLANAAAMAADFADGLPRSESPEATDGWRGYYCPLEIKGDLGSAETVVFVRDFTDAGMERRLAALKAMAAAVEARFPGGKAEIAFKEQYRNMRSKLDERPEVTRILEEAARNAGVEPVSKPIRGGTDGARLTAMGIPTPNVYTGSHNFHSNKEWASLTEMTLSACTLLELVSLWSRER